MKIQVAILLLAVGFSFGVGRYSVSNSIKINPDGTMTVDGINLKDGEYLDVNPKTGEKKVMKPHYCYNKGQPV